VLKSYQIITPSIPLVFIWRVLNIVTRLLLCCYEEMFQKLRLSLVSKLLAVSEHTFPHGKFYFTKVFCSVPQGERISIHGEGHLVYAAQFTAAKDAALKIS